MISQFDLGGLLPMRLLSSIISHVPDSLLDVEIFVRTSGSPPYFTLPPPSEGLVKSNDSENEVSEDIMFSKDCIGCWNDNSDGSYKVILIIPSNYQSAEPALEIAFPEKQFPLGFHISVSPSNILSRIRINFSKTRRRMRISVRNIKQQNQNYPNNLPILVSASKNNIKFELKVRPNKIDPRQISVNGLKIDVSQSNIRSRNPTVLIFLIHRIRIQI